MLQLFLKNISDYFNHQNLLNYSFVCKKHNIEHTGKNVYSAIIDTNLFLETGNKKYFNRAKERVFRTTKHLIKDPDFKYWIFWPGRLDGRNMSNSVIDSGACSDSLSYFYLKCEHLLSENEKNIIKESIFKNCDTYLKLACIDKELTNQRLWGATGISLAYKIFKKEIWKKAILKSINKSFSEMLSDGTFPYHSNYKEYNIFKGIYDTTPFYHSRHIAFIYYSLENIGESLEKYKVSLLKATNLLIGMYQENGVKNLNLETKRWYFLNNYEVASNVYDIYAFIKTYKLTKDDIYLRYAKKALNVLIRHQFTDGGIGTNYNFKNDFQCRVFWTANCAWLSKVSNELNILKNVEYEKDFYYLKYFKNSDILKFVNKKYSFIVRGNKQPQNVTWGPRVGGGSLLYFGNNKSQRNNLLKFKEWSEKDPLNFYIYFKRGSSFLNFIKENKKDLKALLYYIKVEIKARNIKAVSLRINDFLKKIILSDNVIASHFTTSINTKFNKETKNIFFTLNLTNRGGLVVDDILLKRIYKIKDDRLEVVEKLILKNKNVKTIYYIKNKLMKNIIIKTNLKYKERKDKIAFRGCVGFIDIKFYL